MRRRLYAAASPVDISSLSSHAVRSAISRARAALTRLSDANLALHDAAHRVLTAAFLFSPTPRR